MRSHFDAIQLPSCSASTEFSLVKVRAKSLRKLAAEYELARLPEYTGKQELIQHVRHDKIFARVPRY